MERADEARRDGADGAGVSSFEAMVGPELAAALTARGWESLTEVQLAVLEPGTRGRDLRVSSQTGSGKTVAIGIALRELIESARGSASGPRALVIVPTRELARQVQGELSWLYARLGAKVASLTGGQSYDDEHRALAQRPDVVVGTPGRVLDHLEHGSLELSSIGAVVLDEADQMLDLGFREALEAILARAPEQRRSHLVSATFGPEVLRLADRMQRDPMHVQGTRLGEANRDIEHVAHVVEPRQRFDAIVNVLLAQPDDKALVFARTRADVAQIANDLADIGFAVLPLSGEMEQRERNRALAAFRRGAVRVLVATDVAARGLDVQDVALVLHVDPPSDSDAYTHRSGRTGRAGRKGRSVLLLAPREVGSVRRVLGRTRIDVRIAPLPSAEALRRAADERCFETLTQPLTESDDAAVDPRVEELARRLAQHGDVERTLARLLAGSALATGPQPREVASVTLRSEAVRGGRPPRDARDWAVFHVTWGARQGADPRRILAVVCRRGRVTSQEVGGIRVGPNGSLVQIAMEAAPRFAEHARRRDPRAPSVAIRPERGAEDQPS